MILVVTRIRPRARINGHGNAEPWKAPLPQFIEHLYVRSFGRVRPEVVLSIEERAQASQAKKAARKQAKRRRRAQGHDRSSDGGP